MESKFKYCPNCEHMMYQGQRFCPQCHFDTISNQVVGKASMSMNSWIKQTQVTHKYVIVKTPFVNLFAAIYLFFKRSLDFKGVSNRSEFWNWCLFNVFINGMFYIGVMHQITPLIMQPIHGYVSTGLSSFSLTQISLWWFIYLIATALGNLALLVRRLRDTGLAESTIISLVVGGLIPLVNLFVMMVTVCFLICPSMRAKSTTDDQKHDE